MREWIADIAAAATQEARVKVFSSGVPKGDALQQLARVYASDPTAVEADLETLAAIKGMRGIAGRLRSAIVRASRQAPAPRLRIADPDETEPIDYDGEWSAPAGYVVSADGVHRLTQAQDGGTAEVRITHGPVLLVGRSVDVESGEHYLTLAWPDALAGWREAIVPRATALDGRALVALTSQGAPISSPQGREVALYLGAAEASWPGDVERTAGRMGWHEGGVLIAGRTVYEPDGYGGPPLSYRTDDGSEQIAARYRPRGTWAGWLEGWALISERPIAAAAVYAAIAAPLLKIVGCPNFFVDWSARSGRGKTTSLQVAASVWGEPAEDGLIQSWALTPTYAERIASIGCDLPLLLDETNTVPASRRSDLAQLVYTLANGRGKGRGTISGVQRSASWRTIILSTGEARLTAYTQDEGTRGRVISLTGPPLGKHGAERAEQLRATLRAHHGHLGPMMLRWVVSADGGELKARYQQIVAWYSHPERVPSQTARRLAQYVALLDLAREIAHQHLGLPAPESDPIAEVWRQVCDSSSDADIAADALRMVYERAAAEPWAMYGRHLETPQDHQPARISGGWAGAWQADRWDRIAVRPEKLREWLRASGHVEDTILSQWAERGWLHAPGRGRTHPVRIDQVQVRCVVILRSALEEVGAVEAERAARDPWGDGAPF